MMNDAEIRRYAGLMAELGLTGLEVTEKDQVIRLERSPAPAAARETVAVPAAPAAAASQGAAPADTVEVASPMGCSTPPPPRTPSPSSRWATR